MSERAVLRAAWLLPVALTAVVWAPLLRSYFHWDDFLDLYQLQNDSPAQFYLRMYGGHLYIVRNAVTAAIGGLFGPDPRPFFTVAFATHLLNTGLLYALVARLTGRWVLAVLAAAFWGPSPINEGALGWYAVYGQVLATTCILAVLFGLSREGRRDAGWAVPLGWALLMAMGGMLFGVGLASALVMPVAAVLLLPAGTLRRRTLIALVGAAVLLLITYVILRRLEVPLYGEQRSETTLALATLSPAFIGDHLQMVAALFGFGAAMLPLGTLVDPNTFPQPLHLIVVAVAIGLLGVGFFAASPHRRRQMLACLVVVFGIYGLIALGRGMLVGWVGFWPLARSFRYHYGAGAVLAAALAVAAAACAGRWPLPARARQALSLAAIAAVCGMTFASSHRINNFDGDRAATVKVLADIRAAIDAAPPGSTVEIPYRDFGQVGYINVGYRDRFPGIAAVFAIFYPDDVVDGRRVVFTTSDPLVLQARRSGRRSPHLLRESPAAPPAERNPAP